MNISLARALGFSSVHVNINLLSKVVFGPNNNSPDMSDMCAKSKVCRLQGHATGEETTRKQ